MTQEQKDWYDYGRKKAAWLIAKELEPGSEREITQIAWDARRKAYRWRNCGYCDYCKHCPEDGDNMKTLADDASLTQEQRDNIIIVGED